MSARERALRSDSTSSMRPSSQQHRPWKKLQLFPLNYRQDLVALLQDTAAILHESVWVNTPAGVEERLYARLKCLSALERINKEAREAFLAQKKRFREEYAKKRESLKNEYENSKEEQARAAQARAFEIRVDREASLYARRRDEEMANAQEELSKALAAAHGIRKSAIAIVTEELNVVRAQQRLAQVTERHNKEKKSLLHSHNVMRASLSRQHELQRLHSKAHFFRQLRAKKAALRASFRRDLKKAMADVRAWRKRAQAAARQMPAERERERERERGREEHAEDALFSTALPPLGRDLIEDPPDHDQALAYALSIRAKAQRRGEELTSRLAQTLALVNEARSEQPPSFDDGQNVS